MEKHLLNRTIFSSIWSNFRRIAEHGKIPVYWQDVPYFFPINLYYFSICCISKDVRSALSHDFAQSNMFEICPVFKKFDNFIFAANEGERMWQNDINFQPSKPNNNRFLRLNFLVVGKGLSDIFDEGKDDSQQYSHKIRSPPWIWTIFWIGFDACYDFSVLQNQVRLKRDLERENYIRIWSISPSNTIFFFFVTEIELHAGMRSVPYLLRKIAN